MSSRKQAIARIVADEIAKETRRQARRYEANMEPVYIALYENQVAERRLAQLLAGMAPAAMVPAAMRALDDEEIDDETGSECIIKYTDEEHGDISGRNYNNIVDAILEMMETSRKRGVRTWPVFVRKDKGATSTITPIIITWTELCQLSNDNNLYIAEVDESKLPVVYERARLRYGGKNDVIKVHLPAPDTEHDFNGETTYLTDGRNGVIEDLASDLINVQKVRPRVLHSKLYYPQLSLEKDTYTALDDIVQKDVKDLYVFFNPKTEEGGSEEEEGRGFKSITFENHTYVFDGTLADLAYQVMKQAYNAGNTEFACLLHKTSPTATSDLILSLPFENVFIANLVVKDLAYEKMAEDYQAIANQLLYASYATPTTASEDTVIFACKGAIFDLTQWLTVLQKEGVQIDARNAVSGLRAKCNTEKYEQFTKEFYKLYHSTYEAIYRFVKNDMSQYLKAKGKTIDDRYKDKGAFSKFFTLSWKSTIPEDKINELLRHAVYDRRRDVARSTSIRALFTEYVDAIRFEKEDCKQHIEKLESLKEYANNVKEEYTGSKGIMKPQITILNGLIETLQDNCYTYNVDKNKEEMSAVLETINNELFKHLRTDSKDCTAITGGPRGITLYMAGITECHIEALYLISDSKTALALVKTKKLLMDSKDPNLQFQTYVNLKHWIQSMQELRTVTVSAEGGSSLVTDDLVSLQKYKIAQLYLAATEKSSTPVADIIGSDSSDWLGNLIEKANNAEFEKDARIVADFRTMNKVEETPGTIASKIAATTRGLWNFGSAFVNSFAAGVSE